MKTVAIPSLDAVARGRRAARLRPARLLSPACARAAGLLLILLLAAAGCGYTQLKHGDDSTSRAAASDSLARADRAARAHPQTMGAPADTLAGSDSLSAQGEEDDLLLDERLLPPGHPPLTPVEDWPGTSFLDHIVGENDPLRFESLRENEQAFAPAHHATITVRMTTGGPAVADVWQIRMDQFGWVTAAYWTQGAAGPTLDELNATYKAEFRLERQSEAALREMIIELLPDMEDRTAEETSLTDLPKLFRSLPPGWWPFSESGLLEIEYHVESLGLVEPADWPGGKVSARLDLVQLLIGTWDQEPPPWLRYEVRRLIERDPSLVNIALVAEAVVLASEVEGADMQSIQLPLHVGR